MIEFRSTQLESEVSVSAIDNMHQPKDEQQQIIDEQHKKFEALLQQLEQAIPGFSFHAPPT
ncbi:Kinetochore protein nuf2 isoform 1 [Dorcoceras hygrometricum]|uniref:Kinetochore protein nuf2 isoform 1 n=1 Tax=Dorcoceras hygrometricum TaxID=472368 RepID=A0A2Z7D000_9LAMI|nr:Kinetochore protein nuf2 isoform 1 [Dorcoceras hygrometricum]